MLFIRVKNSATFLLKYLGLAILLLLAHCATTSSVQVASFSPQEITMVYLDGIGSQTTAKEMAVRWCTKHKYKFTIPGEVTTSTLVDFKSALWKQQVFRCSHSPSASN